jgi:hypothetical protein
MLNRLDSGTNFLMWDERAYRARREIVALAASGLGVSDLHTAAMGLIKDTVSTDLACWATIDPETLVISTMTSGDARIPPEYEQRLAESEYSIDEPHRFATLARRNESIAKLSDLPEPDRTRSARLNNVWRPTQQCVAPYGYRPRAAGHVHRRWDLLGRGWHGASRPRLH